MSQSSSVLLCSRNHSCISHNKLPGLWQGQFVTIWTLKPELLSTSALTSSACAVWLTQTMTSQRQDGWRDGGQTTALLNNNHVLVLLTVLQKRWSQQVFFCIESLFSTTGGCQPTFTSTCYCHYESFKSTPSLPPWSSWKISPHPHCSYFLTPLLDLNQTAEGEVMCRGVALLPAPHKHHIHFLNPQLHTDRELPVSTVPGVIFQHQRDKPCLFYWHWLSLGLTLRNKINHLPDTLPSQWYVLTETTCGLSGF